MRVLLLLFVAIQLVSTGCGGCSGQVTAVAISPTTSCLTLSVGDPGAPVCGDPVLEGTNACTDTLVLPMHGGGNQDVSIAPGGAIVYSVTQLPNGDDYTIPATLGTQAISITFSVHGR